MMWRWFPSRARTAERLPTLEGDSHRNLRGDCVRGAEPRRRGAVVECSAGKRGRVAAGSVDGAIFLCGPGTKDLAAGADFSAGGVRGFGDCATGVAADGRSD